MPAHLLQEEVSAELRAAPRLAALLCLGLAPASFLAASFLRCCRCRRGQPRVSVRAPMGADVRGHRRAKAIGARLRLVGRWRGERRHPPLGLSPRRGLGETGSTLE